MSELSTVIAVVGCVLSVGTFWIGRQTASRAAGRDEGSLNTDLKYIKESVDRIDKRLNDDVRRLEGRIDEQTAQLLKLADISARGHETAKSAHKRLDEHLEREHDMTVITRKE